MNHRLPTLAGATCALLLVLPQTLGTTVHAEPAADSSEPVVVTVYTDYV